MEFVSQDYTDTPYLKYLPHIKTSYVEIFIPYSNNTLNDSIFQQTRYAFMRILKKIAQPILKNLFGRSRAMSNTLFYNGDGRHDFNMQVQKIAFLLQSQKATVY